MNLTRQLPFSIVFQTSSMIAVIKECAKNN